LSWFGSALEAWYQQNSQANQQLGKGITDAASDISNAVKTAQQNSQANQVASQMDNSGNYAPRAALVSPGTNPITGAINAVRPGTNTSGSAPVQATGGVPGLELQMAVKKAQQESTAATAENQLKGAQTDYYGAHADYMRQQPGIQKAANTAAAKAARESQVDAEKNADTIPRLQKDIDDSYGQGTFQKFTTALSQDPTGASLRGSINTQDGKQYWNPLPNGPLFMADTPPKPNAGWFNTGIGGGPGEMSGETTMPASAFQGFLQRYQKIQGSPTGRYVPPPGAPPATTPGSGTGSGGNGQIPTISDPSIAAKLPPNTVFRTPQGVLKKVPPAPGANPAVTPSPNGQ
jgi:hypothetical protein